MIKNNTLSDILNNYKNNINPNTKSDNIPLNVSPIITLLVSIFMGVINIFKMLVFGYSTRIIFNTSWSFWETACVGVGIFLVFNFIETLFHKIYNL